MKRKPLKRKTPLLSKTRLKQRTPLKGSLSTEKIRAAIFRALVFERDDRRCRLLGWSPVSCYTECLRPAVDPAHIIDRSHLGKKARWLLDNGISAYRPHHDYLHHLASGEKCIVPQERWLKALAAVNSVEKIKHK